MNKTVKDAKSVLARESGGEPRAKRVIFSKFRFSPINSYKVSGEVLRQWLYLKWPQRNYTNMRDANLRALLKHNKHKKINKASPQMTVHRFLNLRGNIWGHR